MSDLTEKIMALADKMRQASVTNFQASDEYRDALLAAVTEQAEALDIQAGSIEAVQAANGRLAEQLRVAQQERDAYNVAAGLANVEAATLKQELEAAKRVIALALKELTTANSCSDMAGEFDFVIHKLMEAAGAAQKEQGNATNN